MWGHGPLHEGKSDQPGREPGAELRHAGGLEARFARSAVDGETLGLSLLKLAPNFRVPFGHKHANQEEVYVIVRGSARIKVDDEIVELGEWDAIRFDTDTMRDVEAGPDGVEYLAFGAGNDPRDAEWCRIGGATSSTATRGG